MWAVVGEQEGPYKVERTVDEGGKLIQLQGRLWFKCQAKLFSTKKAAMDYLKDKKVPWPKGEQSDIRN